MTWTSPGREVNPSGANSIDGVATLNDSGPAPMTRLRELAHRTRSPERGRDMRQKASAEMTSPPALVPSAQYVLMATDDLMNFALPSPNRKLAPPGWLLFAFWYCPSEALELLPRNAHQVNR